MEPLRRIRSLLSEAKAADAPRRSVLAQFAEERRNEGPIGEDLARAVERRKTWFGRRDEIAGRILPDVARWEWSTGRRHTLLPVHFERYPGRTRVLKGRWQLGTRMLREAAAQLTRHPWREALDVTHAFVAFAIDPEADDLEEALRASAPEHLAAWKARGWV